MKSTTNKTSKTRDTWVGIRPSVMANKRKDTRKNRRKSKIECKSIILIL